MAIWKDITFVSPNYCQSWTGYCRKGASGKWRLTIRQMNPTQKLKIAVYRVIFLLKLKNVFFLGFSTNGNNKLTIGFFFWPKENFSFFFSKVSKACIRTRMPLKIVLERYPHYQQNNFGQDSWLKKFLWARCKIAWRVSKGNSQSRPIPRETDVVFVEKLF